MVYQSNIAHDIDDESLMSISPELMRFITKWAKNDNGVYIPSLNALVQVLDDANVLWKVANWSLRRRQS